MKRVVSLFLTVLFVIFAFIGCAENQEYIDCVSGLISDGDMGSIFVVYDTSTWDVIYDKALPDVTSDNYAAISPDGKSFAYTTWEENFINRYLVVHDIATGEEKIFFDDLPLKNEIIKISWMPDNKSILYILNDATLPIYQEIQSVNIDTGNISVLIKGGLWKIYTIANKGEAAENFYLKNSGEYMKVKLREDSTDPNIDWCYYMVQEDITEIYNRYGGVGKTNVYGTSSIDIEFSAPRMSSDGSKIVYSAELDRSGMPIEDETANNIHWLCASIWLYDVETGENKIIYTQGDSGSIGRVDWVDDSDEEITFISFFDYQGSRDAVNKLNLATGEHTVIFPYSKENYNNVTLLPIGNGNISFTSSAMNEFYADSKTYVVGADTKQVEQIDIKYKDKTVLLEKFIYAKTVKPK